MTTIELRESLHAMWDTVAPAWGRHALFNEYRAHATTTRMLAGLKPGDSVLELACGAGGTGIAAARQVGRDGRVVLSDVAPAMVALAGARAAQGRDAGRIRTAVLDMEALVLPDASFDAVLCREGLMLVPDPARAAAEMRRVLRPGGHAVVTTWDRREANPWLDALLTAVGEELGAPVPPPGLPGPFSLSHPDALAGALSAWDEVALERVAVPFHATSPAIWWRRVTALAGPVSQLLAALPAERVDAIRDRAYAAITAYATADGALVIPGTCHLARGRRLD